ncbi:MAG: c-type cytochrome [Betaproteobacteria bacterium]|nr:c-type cytochrome [Betaproteobacteria bacterium]
MRPVIGHRPARLPPPARPQSAGTGLVGARCLSWRLCLAWTLAAGAGPALAQGASAAAAGAGSAAAAGDTGARSGEQVYRQVCAACHDTGVLKAPRLGDAAAWKPLIAEGQKSLVRTAIRGIRQMPPKGGDPGLSPLEVERAVVHMANAAGGRFREPR